MELAACLLLFSPLNYIFRSHLMVKGKTFWWYSLPWIKYLLHFETSSFQYYSSKLFNSYYCITHNENTNNGLFPTPIAPKRTLARISTWRFDLTPVERLTAALCFILTPRTHTPKEAYYILHVQCLYRAKSITVEEKNKIRCTFGICSEGLLFQG